VAPRWNPLYEPLAASTIATWGTTKQRAVFEKGGKRARSSRTAEATAGVPMGDVWDIGVLAPVARERTGYPSQKPEALLDRIVMALSDPGDLVLDPYAGSGTTLAVAAKRGRRFLGIDQSEVALETTLARLRANGVALETTLRRLAEIDVPLTLQPAAGGLACAEAPPTLTVARGKGPSLRRASKRTAPFQEAPTMSVSPARRARAR